ncbi:uncharacterized protein [Misgurnus anguillicaudatus]|uniref:uncharacterized protein n=1 Tax=Misgurnus anguillicaudatus TaxID=75329 RepID=UPI003CCF5A99
MLLQIIAILVFFVFLLRYSRNTEIFKVFLTTHNGQKLTLDVATSRARFENTTIRELKEKISSSFPGKDYNDPRELRIYRKSDPPGTFSSEDLLNKEDKTLGFYNVTDLSTLFIAPRISQTGLGPPKSKDDIVPRRNSTDIPRMNIRNSEIFKVFLTTHHGQRVALDVATSRARFENTTIRELKEKNRRWFSGWGYAKDIYRIFFEGKQLENDKTLGFYKITPGSTLYSSPILRGGGRPPKDKDDVLPRSESMERLYLSM